jgi:transcriptional regulator of nitric oxide reductase
MTATSKRKGKGTPNASGFAKASELNENMLSQSAKLNSQVSTKPQNITQEWSQFVGTRLREDMRLIQTIQSCRSLPDLQQAYTQYWQNAFAQYGEKTRRMLGITQGAVDDAAHAALENGAAKATPHQRPEPTSHLWDISARFPATLLAWRRQQRNC